MSNCANCSTPAVFEYIGSRTPVPYCDKHLPSAFRRPDYAHLVIPVSVPEKPTAESAIKPAPEAPKPSKKSAKNEAPSEAPAEETPTETAPEEEPKQ